VIDECIELIKDIGFPIFVAVFFMVNNNKNLKSLTEAINELKLVIMKIKK